MRNLNTHSHEAAGIGANLEKQAYLKPEKIAIYYNDTEITYKMFAQHVAAYQKKLCQKVDASKSPKVAFLLGNEPMFLEIYFAVIMLGWTAVPFDPKWSIAEAKHIKNMAEPDLMITNDSFKQTAKYNFAEAINVDHAYVNDDDNDYLMVADATKDFYLGFTSGSTGLPKGFIRNQQSWLSSFEAGEFVFTYDEDDVLMAPGPLCHSLSLFGATHALHIGATFCLTPIFSASTVIEMIHTADVTVIYGVPTMFHRLGSLDVYCNKSIIFLSSGAKLQPKVKTKLKSVFPNSIIYEYFGASELSYVTYATDTFNKAYPESVGMPFPSVRITIRNEDGEELPANQLGEIYVESDFLFSGYVQNEKGTKETLTKDGAFIGDIGYVNSVGALTVVGRKNNMMIIGGQNVYPEEVERIIKMSNSVKEAIIIGIEDIHWGERMVAFIEWKDGKNHELKRVKSLCKKYLSVYKRPRNYYTVTSFPYTNTGKIARQQIKENIEEWMG